MLFIYYLIIEKDMITKADIFYSDTQYITC